MLSSPSVGRETLHSLHRTEHLQKTYYGSRSLSADGCSRTHWQVMRLTCVRVSLLLVLGSGWNRGDTAGKCTEPPVALSGFWLQPDTAFITSSACTSRYTFLIPVYVRRVCVDLLDAAWGVGMCGIVTTVSSTGVYLVGVWVRFV